MKVEGMKLMSALLAASITMSALDAYCLERDAKGVYKIDKDIVYRAEAGEGLSPYMKERCRLDVYYPEGRKDFNTVVWFHGGGLTGGQKDIPGGLKQFGVAVVSVEYRLSPNVKCADCIDDAAAAVAWVFENISKYGGSPDKVFVSGHSAGGYLTAMIGLDKSRLAKYGVDANRIAGLMPLSGHTITHFSVRAESGIGDKTPVIDAFAPLYHSRGDAPPILLVTGDREKEMLGRYEENAYFMRMLKLNGHKDVTLFELQGYGHGMVDPAMAPMREFIERVRPGAPKQP